MLRFQLIGVRKLIVEMDVSSTRGMLQNPDTAPSATMNRWIIGINMFHFDLVHVPGEHHTPNGLSRRPAQPGDAPTEDDKEEFKDWIDSVYSFLNIVLPPPYLGNTPLLGSESNREGTASAAEAGGTMEMFMIARTLGMHTVIKPLDYRTIPRSQVAEDSNARIQDVQRWLELGELPLMNFRAREQWQKYVSQFFMKDSKMWRVTRKNSYQRVLDPSRHVQALVDVHDYLGHRGIHAMLAFLRDRFWWPEIKADVAWYVETCHKCQIHHTTCIQIPPTVPYPAAPFVRVHVDTMDMPAPFKNFLHARCTTMSYSEGRTCKQQTAKVVSDWIFQDLLCQWGAISEIVSDNGTPFVKVLDYLAKQYHINHIHISGYNSQANGIVERPHFHVHDALFKSCAGEPTQWARYVPYVLWADRITTRRCMGVSPYFAVTGTHPILPFDIAEATYLMP